MKSRFAVAVVAGALTLGLMACGGGKSGESAGNAAPAEKAASTPAPPAAGGTGGAEFGVPECDEYIAKYTACIDSKVPESARVMIRQQLDATKASWKQAASTPEGRTGLATGCKQAIEAARTAMQAYGCSW
jgi:hypothetical protein